MVLYMNLLFMIGNGFDKNLGLKTSYTEFYDYYVNLPSENEIIKKFKEDIKKENYKDWADLEFALGQYSDNFNNEDDYICTINDVSKELKKYLELLQEEIIFDNSIEKVREEFLNFKQYLSNANQIIYDKFIEKEQNLKINIINFNYTNTLERILKIKVPFQLNNQNINGKMYSSHIKKHIHVHGDLKDSMILGVNDYTQIKNEKMRTTKVIENIVKPTMNINAETLRENDCEKIINEANIIVIYGMSIGETDKCWWEKLMLRFSQDPSVLIIIINYDEQIEYPFRHLFAYKKREFKNRLLNYVTNNDSQLSENELKTIVENRIIVEFNTQMFKFKLYKKDKVA